MTEAEWLACENPHRALAVLGGSLNERKRRLFAVACCRRIEELILRFKGAWRAVVLAERIADGAPVTEEAIRLREGLPERAFCWIDGHREEKENQTMWNVGNAAACCLVGVVGPEPYFSLQSVALTDASHHAAWAVAHWARRNDREPHQFWRVQAEWTAQLAVLRDIAAGDPILPVAFSPAWRTDTVVSLAWHIYESRDFSAMPILADALQDAGCDSADILNHCRGSGPHVRGCWVVDLLLGL